MVSGVRCNTAQIGFSTLKGSHVCSGKSRIPFFDPDGVVHNIVMFCLL